MAHVMQNRYLLTGMAASIVGCAVRVSHDKELNPPTFKEKVGYYFTGLFIAYIVFSVLFLFSYEKSAGLFCAIAGILSKEVMHFITKDLPMILPAVFKKWIYKRLNIDEDKSQKPNV